MPELQLMFHKHRKYLFFMLSIFVIGWGFTSYQSVFLGLILGTCLSFFNHWLMIRKVSRFGDAVVEGRRVLSLGTFTRMATAILGVYIATKYPEYFHLLSVIIGLMTSYVVIMIDFMFSKHS